MNKITSEQIEEIVDKKFEEISENTISQYAENLNECVTVTENCDKAIKIVSFI